MSKTVQPLVIREGERRKKRSYANIHCPAIKLGVSKFTIANNPPAARVDEMGSLPNSSLDIGTKFGSSGAPNCWFREVSSGHLISPKRIWRSRQPAQFEEGSLVLLLDAQNVRTTFISRETNHLPTNLVPSSTGSFCSLEKIHLVLNTHFSWKTWWYSMTGRVWPATAKEFSNDCSLQNTLLQPSTYWPPSTMKRLLTSIHKMTTSRCKVGRWTLQGSKHWPSHSSLLSARSPRSSTN